MNTTDFTDWRLREIHLNKEFIEDGIIDFQSWSMAEPKILFLAKEAYTGGKGFDLCEFIRTEDVFHHWHTVADWTYAVTKVLNEGKIPGYREEEFINDIHQWVRKIAIVNIKKSGGESSSDNDNLDQYVKSDKDLLRQQIDQIDPDVVLCCYTYDLLYKKIYENSVQDLSEWCYNHKINGKTRLVIDYWHFANRYPNQMAYYALCAILMKYIENQTSV